MWKFLVKTYHQNGSHDGSTGATTTTTTPSSTWWKRQRGDNDVLCEDGAARRRAARPGDSGKRAFGHLETPRRLRRSRPGVVALLRGDTGVVARDRRDIPAVVAAEFDEPREQSGVQRAGTFAMRGEPPGHEGAIFERTRALVFVPVFKHGEQNETVRVFEIDEFRSDRSAGESGRHRGDQLSLEHRNYSTVLANDGIRVGTVKNGGDVHRAENFIGRSRAGVYVRDGGEVLRGRIGFRGDGRTVGRTAEREIAEAHREVLFTVER